MNVDAHAHYAPQRMLDAHVSRRASLPNVELTYEEDTYKPGSAGGALTWPVNPRLRHPEPRQVWMAEQGIDVQINGGWLDSFGYVLPPYKGHAWSRFLKEHLIAASNEKDNQRALGSITLQDGEKAALLLEGLVGEGLAGVMIGTQLHGDHSNLDDPALNPFWAVASDHKAVVFIHPMYGCNDIRLNDYDIIKAVGQGLDLDNTTALVSMFYAGHLLDTPACPWFCRIMPVAGLGWLDGYTTNTIIYLDQYADPVEGFSRIYFLCRRIRSGRSQFSDGQGGCG